MTKDKKDSQDLTRIEDLSDFLHDEDEEISLLEDKESKSVEPEKSMMDLEKESFGDSTSFMQIPDELNEFSDAQDQEDDQEDDQDSSNFDTFNDNDFESSDFENNEDSFEQFEEETEQTSEDDLALDFDNDFNNDFENDFEISASNDETDSFENLQDEIDSDEIIDEASDDDFLETLDISTQVEPETNEKSDKVIPILAPKDYRAPEKLDEIKEFGQTITSTDLSIEGNPPFSIIASNIKYLEDAQSILEILKEYKIIKQDHEKDAQASLERGQILIPRLSEYSAIILCHRLRRFNLNLKMGLSHEVHKSSTFENSDKGLVSKANINTSIKKYENLSKESILTNDVQVSTQGQLDNYLTVRSVLVKSRSKVVSNEMLDEDQFDETYEKVQLELIEILKQDAADLNANALLNVSLTLINKAEDKTNFICTANITVVVPK